MKKALAIIAVVAFMVAFGAPAFANDQITVNNTVQADDPPKKKAKSEKKTGECGDATEKSSCCDKKSSCDTKKEKK